MKWNLHTLVSGAQDILLCTLRVVACGIVFEGIREQWSANCLFFAFMGRFHFSFCNNVKRYVRFVYFPLFVSVYPVVRRFHFLFICWGTPFESFETFRGLACTRSSISIGRRCGYIMTVFWKQVTSRCKQGRFRLWFSCGLTLGRFPSTCRKITLHIWSIVYRANQIPMFRYCSRLWLLRGLVR